jgi:hypothetical protein
VETLAGKMQIDHILYFKMIKDQKRHRRMANEGLEHVVIMGLAAFAFVVSVLRGVG